MTIRRLLAVAAIGIVVPVSASYAGPCLQEIGRMQAKIDARLEARAAAGSSAPESTAATQHHQPTPDSIAATEIQLGNVSPERVTAVFAAMGRAREADRVSDQNACEQALNEVQRTLNEVQRTLGE